MTIFDENLANRICFRCGISQDQQREKFYCYKMSDIEVGKVFVCNNCRYLEKIGTLK